MIVRVEILLPDRYSREINHTKKDKNKYRSKNIKNICFYLNSFGIPTFPQFIKSWGPENRSFRGFPVSTWRIWLGPYYDRLTPSSPPPRPSSCFDRSDSGTLKTSKNIKTFITKLKSCIFLGISCHTKLSAYKNVHWKEKLWFSWQICL